MAIIKISELRPAGYELFQDSESFLNELTEREMSGIEGGGWEELVSSVTGSTAFNTALNTAGNTALNTNGNTALNTNKVGC